MAYPTREIFQLDIDKILNLKSEDYNVFIEDARKFADNDNTTPNQIRNFYDDMICPLKNKEGVNLISDIGKIRIMLAYAKGRNNISETFYKNLDNFCNKLMINMSKDRLKRFVDFMEAFVAFNKLKNSNKR